MIRCVHDRSPSSGGGKTDRGVVREARSQRDRVPGGRGEEEQPGAEADSTDIPGGVAGISHLRAGTTVAQPDQSSARDTLGASSTLNRRHKKLKRSVMDQEIDHQARHRSTTMRNEEKSTRCRRRTSLLFIFIERSRFDGRALSQVLIEPGLGGGNSRGRTNKREKREKERN